MLRAVAAKIDADLHPGARRQGLARRPCKAAVVGGHAVGKQAVDDPLGRAPLAQDEAVIIDRPGQLLFQLGDELGVKRGVVVYGGGLAEKVGVAVDEGFQPVVGVGGVGGAIEVAVGAAQAGLEHLEDVLVPGGHLVAVGVLDRHALDAGDVLFVVGAQNMDPPAEQPHRVVARDGAHQRLPPYIPHGVEDVAGEGALGVAQQDGRAFPLEGQQAFRDDHRVVQPGLPAAGRPDLEIPPVIAPVQVLDLFTR